jgi:ribose transport system substrate-binding protein
MPSFNAPGEPVDASKVKGKTIWIVLGNGGVPFLVQIADGITEAAAAVGVNVKMVDGKGQAPNWSKTMKEAIAQHADAIITDGAPPTLIKKDIAAAGAANIPVVDTLDLDQTDPLVDGQFATVSISFGDSGARQADYVIAQQQGKPTHVLVYGDSEFPSEVKRVEGIKAEFAKLAPNIEVTVKDTLVSKIATDLRGQTQTDLRRDPKIEWVLPTYDAQALYVVPAIKSAGMAKKVKVVSSDAVKANLDFVAKGDVQVFDVGPPDIWIGWAAVDSALRGMLGQDAVEENVPLRVFVEENLQGVDTGDQDALVGSEYRDGYKQLWGVG